MGIKHKTSSLFIKALPALLTKDDLLEVARRYPGFLRAAASDADPKSHFSRRCWLSFERNSAKIREICFALNNVQVKGFDLAPLVNKDLTRRMRPASENFSEEYVMRQDLTAVCRIAAFQDSQAGLWMEEVGEGVGGGVVKNPLIAEAEGLRPEESLEEVKSVLDKLLLYLRVVHSIDYYNQVGEKIVLLFSQSTNFSIDQLLWVLKMLKMFSSHLPVPGTGNESLKIRFFK